MTDVAMSPTRKDAARNRARLLEAADELLSTQGLDVTLKDVARHAQVGVGTVYRHFPTKEELLGTLFAEQLDSAVEVARKAAADPDGWRGLVTYLEESLLAQASNSGFRGLLNSVGQTVPSVVDCRARTMPFVEQIVTKAQEQGTLRADFQLSDIAYMQIALASVMAASRETSPDEYRRHLKLYLDAMRSECQEAAPADSISRHPV